VKNLPHLGTTEAAAAKLLQQVNLPLPAALLDQLGFLQQQPSCSRFPCCSEAAAAA
jgi:hypothetical protein